MSNYQDEQYREQTKRAEASLARVKAWFGVWVREPAKSAFSPVLRAVAGQPMSVWVGAGALVLLVGFVIWLGFPILWHIRAAAWGTLPEAGSEAFGRLATQVAAVVGGVVGLVFLGWRTWLTHRQTHIANETLYTQLLTKAVEQLGATREEKETRETKDANGVVKFETITKTVPNTEVRLGAIYALEKIARDYLPLHWPVMEILCAYVRKNAGPARPGSEKIRAMWKTPILKRAAQEQERRDELKAPFPDVQAALTVIGRRSPAQLAWEASRRAANGEAYRLDLRGCHLALADLAHLCFVSARFEQTSLEGARLREGHFEGANLNGAFLEGADLFATRLDGADFSNAYLHGANISRSSLVNSQLFLTHLDGANVYGANFTGAVLLGSDFKNVNISAANLEGAVFLSEAQLSGSWGTFETRLPSNLTRPTNDRWLTWREPDESDIGHSDRHSRHNAAWTGSSPSPKSNSTP